MGARSRETLLQKDLVWLADLRKKLEQEVHSEKYGRGVVASDYRMSQKEWDKVLRLIKLYELPCVMGDCNFGFQYALNIYNHIAKSGDEPKFIIMIGEKQLPSESEKTPDKGKVWELFSGLVKNKRNVHFLDLYGLKKIRERSHYDY